MALIMVQIPGIHMSHRLNSLKEGTIIGLTKGGTRNLDYSSYRLLQTSSKSHVDLYLDFPTVHHPVEPV